jgi:molecular chaperone GrpE (heat shock protein)
MSVVHNPPLLKTPIQPVFSRAEWTEDLWEGVRKELLSTVRLPKSTSEEVLLRESKPTRKMLLEVISILDGMERLVGLADQEALDANPVLRNWLTSIRGLQRRMTKSLERLDVRPVASLGRRFNVHLHEAVEVRKDPAYPPATVIEVREKPYRWGERVLRVGKVVVTPKSFALQESPLSEEGGSPQPGG